MKFTAIFEPLLPAAWATRLLRTCLVASAITPLLLVAFAAGAAPSPKAAGQPQNALPAGQEAPGSITDTPVEERLGRRLRCPVCQGMSIGDSPSPMAQDMMRQVRKLHAAGESEQAIVAYFTARYGDWVLLDPPAAGAGIWVWLLPPLALFLGLLIVMQRAQAQATAAAAEPLVEATKAAGAPPASRQALLLAQVRDRVNR